MIEKLRHKFALSREGAIDMIKACVSVTFTNMALMMTATVLYILIEDLLNDNLTSERIPVYAVMSAVIIILVAVTEFI